MYNILIMHVFPHMSAPMTKTRNLLRSLSSPGLKFLSKLVAGIQLNLLLWSPAIIKFSVILFVQKPALIWGLIWSNAGLWSDFAPLKISLSLREVMYPLQKHIYYSQIQRLQRLKSFFMNQNIMKLFLTAGEPF